jgi:hypothetical protein
VRIVRLVASSCAVIALVMACLAGDPQGPRLIGDRDDSPAAAADLSDMLPAVPATPALVPPKPNGSVHVDHRPPPSRLTTAEVFRPPRGRA